MKAYIDTSWAFIMLFISLFILAPGMLLTSIILVLWLTQWFHVLLSIMIVAIVVPISLYLAYHMIAMWAVAIWHRKSPIFEFDEYIFSYRESKSLQYSSIQVAEIESVTWLSPGRGVTFVSIQVKNKPVINIRTDYLEVHDAKEILDTFQKIMKLNKAQYRDGCDLIRRKSL
jgi:hypothetical protein